MEHLKGASLGQAPALLSNISFRVDRPAREKHSSLLQTLVNYGHKKFYNIESMLHNFLPHLQTGQIS
jgi:hypothetical protein